MVSHSLHSVNSFLTTLLREGKGWHATNYKWNLSTIINIATKSLLPALLGEGLPIVCIIQRMVESSGAGTGDFVAIFMSPTAYHVLFLGIA